MTEQEKINADVQMQLALQDAKFNVFMQEMRDRDKQRAAEISELRQKQDDAQAKHDADTRDIDWAEDMRKMQKKFDYIEKDLRRLNVTFMIGAATAVFGLVVGLIAFIYLVLSR